MNECDCYRCGACVSECRTSAITVGEHVTIDAGKCIGCGECAEVCPAGAIIMDF